ncbi:hypothetical protein BpHYR1_054453, partial [Brachionus plicatilis]
NFYGKLFTFKILNIDPLFFFPLKTNFNLPLLIFIVLKLFKTNIELFYWFKLFLLIGKLKINRFEN